MEQQNSKNRIIRWGLLGAGSILDRWMNGAMQVDNMEIVAIASRSVESAKKMAQKYGIKEVLTYDEMIAREDIDVVYIPVPHTAHKELAIRAMQAKKAVLVEKPAGINTKEVEEMLQAAKENQVFYMEAVWTKFFPIIKEIEKYIGENGIGEVRTVSSDFSFRTSDTSSRLLDPERAGGALLDTGVYNLHFQRMIYKKSPVRLTGLAAINTDELHLEIDEQGAYIALYDKGELGVMSSAVRTDMIDTAYIFGTKGHIVVPDFWRPQRIEVCIGGETKTIEAKVDQKVPGIIDEGYQYEIIHVNECLRKGLKESPVMTWEDSLEILKQCDELRKQWKLVYPKER